VGDSYNFPPSAGRLSFSPDRTNRANWGWFLALGLSLVVLGVIALATTVMTTVVSLIFLGVMLLTGGFLLLLSAFTSHSWGTALLRVAVGILALLAGWYLMAHPASAAIALTLVLAWYFILSGLFRLIGVVLERPEHWGWVVASGLVSIVLGILLLAHWPITGLFAIGLFIGIDLVIYGLSWIMASVIARSSAPPTTTPSPAL
jgi:uncharacterized membrane protein HdeD (DUF308 family)